jgi:hypothetical protein
MKKRLRNDPAFRTVFIVLLLVSFSLLFWECSRLQPNPSRVNWPPPPTPTPEPPAQH